jgi:HEAT repeat protein
LGLALIVGGTGAARADRVTYFIGQLEASGFKVRLQAAYILGLLKDRRAVPGLVKALGDPHYAVRAAAAMSLGKIGEPAAAEALIRAASDEESWVRAEVMKALGLLGARVAIATLWVALDDADWKVRLEASKALGRIPDKRSVGPLARILERGLESEDLVAEARRALRRLASVVDVSELIEKLRGSSDKHERARAAVVLDTLGDRSAVPALIEGLSDKDSYVRWRCALALAGLGDRRALDPLKKLLDRENDQRVRTAAEFAVRRLSR